MSANNENNNPNGGRPAGTVNWSQQEFTDLFSVMEEILPIGSDQWQQLAQIHANKYPARCLSAIRRKYNILCRKAIPTGDPMCPPEVRWAKKIMHLIADKVHLAHCEEKFDLVKGFPKGYVAPPLFVPGADRPEPGAGTMPPPEAFAPPPPAEAFVPGAASTLGSDSAFGTIETRTNETTSATKTPTKRSYKSTNKMVETIRSDLKDALAEHKQAAEQQKEVFASLLGFLQAGAKKKKTQEDSDSDSDSDSDDSIDLKPVKKKQKRLGGKPTKMKTRRRS